MRKDRNKLFLLHIRDAIEKIESYMGEGTFSEFAQKNLLFDAVVREIEIIGEAANHLSEDFIEKHPKIPWKEITGIRNKLIHDYWQLDLQVIWDTLQKDLPQLKEQILALLKRSTTDVSLYRYRGTP